MWRSQVVRVADLMLSYSKIEALFTKTVIGPSNAEAARDTNVSTWFHQDICLQLRCTTSH